MSGHFCRVFRSATVLGIALIALSVRLDAQNGSISAMGIFHSSPPSLSDGQHQELQLDSSARLIVNCGSGCGGSGGTSLADEATFTQGTTSLTPIGGLYTTSPAALTTGQAGVVRLMSDRTMMIDIKDVADNAAVTAATGVLKVGIVGAAGGVFDAIGQNVAQAANEILIGCAFNTSPTTVSNGNMTQAQCDSAANILVDLKTAIPAGTNLIGYTRPPNGCGNTFYESLPAYLANASTQITATATCVTSLLFFNKDTAQHTVTIQDQSTGCNTGVCQFLTSYPLPANTGWVRIPMDGAKFVGGIKANADAANVVIVDVIGNQ